MSRTFISSLLLRMVIIAAVSALPGLFVPRSRLCFAASAMFFVKGTACFESKTTIFYSAAFEYTAFGPFKAAFMV